MAKEDLMKTETPAPPVVENKATPASPRVFTDAQKREIVANYYKRPEGQTRKEYCEKVQIQSGQLSIWSTDPRYEFKSKGAKASNRIMRPGVVIKQPGVGYPEELKGKVVAAFRRRKLDGLSSKEVAEKFGVPPDTMYYWMRQREGRTSPSQTPKKLGRPRGSKTILRAIQVNPEDVIAEHEAPRIAKRDNRLLEENARLKRVNAVLSGIAALAIGDQDVLGLKDMLREIMGGRS